MTRSHLPLHSRLAATLALSVLLAAFNGCSKHDTHDHASSHGHEHGSEPHDDHGDHGHDHPEGEAVVSITQYTEKTELFMEHAPLIRGVPEQLIVHLTRLSDFSPIAQGALEVRLISSSGERYATKVESPSKSGLFLPIVEAPFSGPARMELHLSGPETSDIQIVAAIQVYATPADAAQLEEHPEESPDRIPYLKEQQWQSDFATEVAQSRKVSHAVPAIAHLELPKTRQAIIPAPISGIVRYAPQAGLLEEGSPCAPGQPLFIIEPDADWQSGLADLRKEYQLAHAEQQRVEQLQRQGAVPEKRVIEARIQMQALEKAIARLGGSASDPDFQVRVNAPLSGILAEVSALSGQQVQAGEPLALIVDPSQLILETRVAPARLENVGLIIDAAFRPAGSQRTYRISELGGRLLSSTALASPADGVAVFHFLFDNPDAMLISGSKAVVHLLAESNTDAKAAIPLSAVNEDAGQSYVYVHLEGETIEKRVPKLGASDGEFIEILSGIEAGERVVTRGANLIRLSTLSSDEMGHGHAH